MASLFTSQTPASGNLNDGTPTITRGVTLQFGVAGSITHARWWCPTTNSGTYTVAVWELTSASTGTLKASKTHVGTPTADAWNLTALDTPVVIDTAKAYRIGVNNSEGRYVASANFFATPLVNGDITAEANGAAAGGFIINQGVFNIGASIAFPNTVFNQGNYFVDVVFTADGGGVSPTGLAIPLTFGSPTVGLGINAQPTGLSIPISFGSPTVTTPAQPAPAPTTVNRGGWFGLLAIAQEAREMRREDRARQPIECPHDGQPLDMNAEGILHCPYDGWIWNGSEVL